MLGGIEIMTKYIRGSEWRRWDLHVHTASSYDYKYKNKDSDELLCRVLKENKVVACAITDHFLIDESRIKQLRNIAPDITFFPAVELRTDKGDTNIHVILIFSDECNLKELCEDFNVFKRSKGKNIDDDQKIYWDYSNIVEFSEQHDGIISIHAGKKTSGVDDRISNMLPHNQAVKKEYASTVDIFEMGQAQDCVQYEEKVFPSIGKKAMVLCSDNHDPMNYHTKAKLWIKADPNFKGLKQAVIEPDRIFIGEKPPTLERVRKNKTKTIDKVNVTWASNYEGNYGAWFKDVEIEFNPEMSVIIGNKGSGKTAIAEVVGLLGNSKNSSNFVFLNKDKFMKKKLALNFVASLTWSDETCSEKIDLNQQVDQNADERIHFVPQNSFEKFCNDNGESFVEEVNNVVFSQINDNDKMGYSSFEELLSHEKSPIDSRKRDIESEIETINTEVKSLEDKRDVDYQQSLLSSLETLKLELKGHNEIEPQKVAVPNELKSEVYQENERLLEEVEKEIAQNNEAIKELTKTKSDLSLIQKAFLNLERTIESKVDEISAQLTEYNIEVPDVFKYTFDLDSINQFYNQNNVELERLTKLVVPEDELNEKTAQDTLTYRQKNIHLILQKINDDNAGKLTAYQTYISESKEWGIKHKDLTDKVEKLQKEIDYIGDFINSELNRDIKQKRSERLSKVKELFTCYKSEQLIYDHFKIPIDQFLESYSLKLKNFPTTINSGIYAKEDFANTFVEEYITSTTNSEFKGLDGTRKIKEYVAEADFTTGGGLEEFIALIESDLDKGFENKCIHKAFKRGKYEQFSKDFYKLSFLEARYSLQLLGKELNTLSPGERGSLLLVFYLVLDARDTPLILDQPEDNLDNQSVAEILVPFIKIAKKRRQIIIITHNSNLAVVSDAEQVIRVKLDKQKDNKFTYESGSLESEIIHDVVDVLEGTIQSFNIRKNKYPN